MKWLKLSLKILGSFVGALILGVLLATAFILIKPESILHTASVSRLFQRFSDLNWKVFDFKIKRTQGLHYQTEIHFENLCFGPKMKNLSGCLDKAELDADFRLSITGLQTLRAKKILLSSEELKFIQASETRKEEKAKPKVQNPIQIPRLRLVPPKFFKKILVENFDLSFKAFEVLSRDSGQKDRSQFLGRLEIHKVKSALWHLKLAGELADHEQVDANLDLKTNFISAEEPNQNPYAEIDFEIFLASLGKAKGNIHFEQNPDSSQLILETELSSQDLSAHLNVDLKDRDQELSAQLSLLAKRQASQFEMEKCDFNLKFADERRLQEISAKCPLVARMAEAASQKTPRVRRFPKDLNANLSFKAKNADKKTKLWDLEASAEAIQFPDWIKDITASVRVSLSAPLNELKEKINTGLKFNAEFKIPEFASVVKYFSKTALSIPAPLNSLKGPVHLTAKSEDRAADQLQAIDLVFATDLASPEQSLKTSANAKLEFANIKGPYALTGEMALEQITLVLPYLKPTKIPSLKKDPRISDSELHLTPAKKIEEKKAPLFSKLDFHIFTRENPVIIKTNLAKDPIPIELDLHLDPQLKLLGKISAKNFRVEYFRQIALVDHINIVNKEDAQSGEIDGLIIYKTPEVKVKIGLIGSVDRPRVEMTSEPPMQTDQIVALLLFGKTTDLNSDESASVGNAEAAFTSGAFGLASLYLFANTPIEYVGYNPAERTYMVRLSLGGGLSVELGSNMEDSRYVGLRKRLGSHWALQTELRYTEEEGSAVATFLEWFHRF